jgi:hypothetical protein
MKSLRWLEVEIEDDGISRDAKVDFCMNLGYKLSDIAERSIDVLFVEKLVEKLKVTKRQDMSWGNPGDDHTCALDG